MLVEKETIKKAFIFIAKIMFISAIVITVKYDIIATDEAILITLFGYMLVSL